MTWLGRDRKNGGRKKNDNERNKIIILRVIFVIQKDLFFITARQLKNSISAPCDNQSYIRKVLVIRSWDCLGRTPTSCFI